MVAPEGHGFRPREAARITPVSVGTPLLSVVGRRKWLIISTLVIAVLVAALASQMVDKVYSTSSTLLVSQRSDNQSFDTVQASQAIARSYADIIESPNIASQVARRLGGTTTKNEIENATTFEVVPETQLLRINAEAANGLRAKQIADTYAAVFIEYAGQNLSDTTQATISLADRAPVSALPVTAQAEAVRAGGGHPWRRAGTRAGVPA